MCLSNTGWVLVLALAVAPVSGQVPRPDWRRIGNSAIERGLAGLATGPVDRVWYAEDGSRLFARTRDGRTLATADFESWTALAAALPPAAENLQAASQPEGFARVRAQSRSASTLYAFGRYVYRSEDGGRNWANLTRHRTRSLIGDGVADVAVSPRDADEVAVAADTGVWRSVDGGLSWSSLNQDLPNLPLARLVGLPADTRGVRISAGEATLEWAPGEKQAWRIAEEDWAVRDAAMKRRLSETLRARITAAATSGDFIYAGSADGELWASQDRGRSWRKAPDTAAAPVEQITVDTRDARLALVALGARRADQPASARAPHVVRILNGGAFWDDLTANLPDIGVHGVAFDRQTGAVYIATDRGLYMAFEDLVNAAPAAAWIPLTAGLPDAPAMDVKLDPAGNQLYVAIDGFGVYAAPAPHRFRDVRVVNAADFSSGAAAPGSLLSVLGTSVRSARAGGDAAAVLAVTETKSEIQVPYEARGTSLALAIEGAGGSVTLGLPLQNTAPAIFIDRDGSPVLLDADSGVMLDAMNPARSNARLQVLAAGLGRVRPDWPTGTPAPAENPPAVIAPIRAYLDRVPVEVTRAVLAPGYVGFYLIEIQLPKLVNYGPAELYIEADGQPSNRVRVYIEP